MNGVCDKRSLYANHARQKLSDPAGGATGCKAATQVTVFFYARYLCLSFRKEVKRIHCNYLFFYYDDVFVRFYTILHNVALFALRMIGP